MNIKKILVGTAAGALILGSIATSAFAAAPSTAPGLNKIQCFDGVSDSGSGVCTLNSKGAKGSATLDLSGAVIGTASYAGVYTLESKLYNTAVTNLTQLSYQYSGTVVPSAGNLSYNIPIDANSFGDTSVGTPDGITDFYLFVDAAHDGIHCPGVNGIVDIINDTNCVMYVNGVTPYANWAAFVTAYPNAMIASDQFAFIVAERTPSELAAVWTVNNVKFGKGGK